MDLAPRSSRVSEVVTEVGAEVALLASAPSWFSFLQKMTFQALLLSIGFLVALRLALEQSIGDII